MDHYSKIIIGYRIEKSSSAIAIKSLIQNAIIEHQPEKLQFLADGGSENVNAIVSKFINSPDILIKHIIAGKEMVFSNSMMKPSTKSSNINFYFLKKLHQENNFPKILEEVVNIYNTIRPQMSLSDNTPEETFEGLSIDISKYTSDFKEQKPLRNQLNKKNNCRVCF